MRSHHSDNSAYNHMQCILEEISKIVQNDSKKTSSECSQNSSEQLLSSPLSPLLFIPGSFSELMSLFRRELTRNSEILSLYIGHESVWRFRYYLIFFWLEKLYINLAPSFGLELMEAELCLVGSIIYPNQTKEMSSESTTVLATTITEPTVQLSKLSTNQVQQLEQAVGYILHVHHEVAVRKSQLAAQRPVLQEHVTILNQLLDKISSLLRRNKNTIELIVVSRPLLINMITDICNVIY